MPWTAASATSGTTSSYTGPAPEVNLAGTFYYVEASNRPEHEAHVLTYVGDACDAIIGTLRFKYHMHGDQMGVLQVQSRPGGEVVWVRMGEQHEAGDTPWEQASIALNAPGFAIMGFVGDGYTSDMAIDEVQLHCASAPPPSLPSPSPEPSSPPGPPRTPAFVVSSETSCANLDPCMGVYNEYGTTASGRPFYRREGTDYYMYYDPSCNAGSTGPRWISMLSGSNVGPSALLPCPRALPLD